MGQLFQFNHPITGKVQKVSTPIIAKVVAIGTLSSAEAPAGYAYENSNNNNNKDSVNSTCKLIDMTVPSDRNIALKETEKNASTKT